MILRTIRVNEPLDDVAEDLLFTASRLKSDPNGKEFADTVNGLIGQVDQVRSGQVSISREEIVANAAVAAANDKNDKLDDWVEDFARILEGVVRGDTEAPLYRQYLTSAPWTIARMGLESEISRVRAWGHSLASESNPISNEQSPRLAALIAQGEEVLDLRRKAGGARGDHLVRSITTLIEQVNTARAALLGQLATKAAAVGMPVEWPSRFFRKNTHAKSAPAEDSGKEKAEPDAPESAKA